MKETAIALSFALLLLGGCSTPESPNAGNSLLRDTSSTPSSATRPMAGASAAQGVSGAAGSAHAQRQGGNVPGAMTTTGAAGGGSAFPGTAGAAAPGVATAGAGGSSGASAATAGTMAAAGTGSSSTEGPMAAAGAGGGSGPSMSSGPSMGTLTIKFTTKSYGGFYAPLNYGAVWFESANGDFIKTVKRWAGAAHAGDLGAWTSASGGWGSLFGGGNMADMMDAMSSATLRQHESHTVMWNMKDSDKMVVPDGDYVAVVELTEDRAATPGPMLRVPFKKGSEPQMIAPPDEMSFTDISLTYQP